MSIRSVPSDVLFICAELTTGKSIPVLVAIARLPMDQILTWVMLCMGAVAGTLFSVYSSRVVAGMTQLGFINRLIQLCFSIGLSLSLLLSVARGIHVDRGVALSIIPAFCVVVQSLPQRESTAMVAFILNFFVFYVCMVTMAWSQFEPPVSGYNTHGITLVQRPPGHTAATLYDEAASVGQTVGRALQLFLLAFYACIQHAPTTVYFAIKPDNDDADHAAPTVYASHHHARHAHYSLFIALVAAWIRLCVWSSVCFFQDNFMHVVLENERTPNGPQWDWFCCFVYMTALLYSACWTATQLREQVLPRFNCGDGGTDMLKILACVLALSALLRFGHDQAMFVATNALTGLCVVTTVLTLKAIHDTA